MKKTIITLSVLVCILFIWLFLVGKSAASLESSASGKVETNLAKWNILVNGTDVSSSKSEELNIDDIKWDSNSHTKAGKAAPGTKGTVSFKIDPSKTNVAIKYTINIVSRDVNPAYVISLKDIKTDGTPLTKTGPNTYTGVFTLDDIKKGTTKTVTLDVEWINDESFNESDTAAGSPNTKSKFLDINLDAVQYAGESITEYKG